MDNEKIIKLIDNLRKLSDGVDPLSDIKFSEDSILNSEYNKHVLRTTIRVLENYISNIDKRLKQTFHITIEEKNSINFSTEPIPISTFVYEINKRIDTLKMKKIKAVQITEWLVKNDYLKEIAHDDGKKFKILTEKSREIGMVSKHMENSYGRKYDINLYNVEAQKFIVEHLNEMINL